MKTRKKHTRKVQISERETSVQLESEDYIILRDTYDYLKITKAVVPVDLVISCFITELESTTDALLAESYRRLLTYLYKTPSQFV
ncbi:hypothetical protein XK97_20985 [Obesumbacterium proteus]|uniref:hypothetical protein n=1 Tax=Obesumbacterium proteus TaxID=82983 RepID=UPI000621D1A0|nr:hypothetical protein [Obesumbacterium proteus]KKI41265.1 hypothetical protein XK97_20985 [Obesumbacterium proteus]